MKNFWRVAVPTLIVLACLATTGWAETRYISDQLIVSLREQPQNGAPSITYLRSDMPVEVLEESGDYIKVRTKAGETGYIKENYLTTQTPKSVLIKQLQRERNRLADKAKKLQDQSANATSESSKSQQELTVKLKALRGEVSALQKSLEKSQSTLAGTSKKYQALQEDAKNVVEITRERDQLRITNQELTASIAKLDEEVSELTMTGVIKWFLAGAGVLFLGWIIGKASGSRRRPSLL
jgi:SH3 domain protein